MKATTPVGTPIRKPYPECASYERLPENCERVYDIRDNTWRAVPKLSKPWTVVLTFTFTNEKDAELVNILRRQPGFVSLTEVTPAEGAD